MQLVQSEPESIAIGTFRLCSKCRRRAAMELRESPLDVPLCYT